MKAPEEIETAGEMHRVFFAVGYFGSNVFCLGHLSKARSAPTAPARPLRAAGAGRGGAAPARGAGAGRTGSAGARPPPGRGIRPLCPAASRCVPPCPAVSPCGEWPRAGPGLSVRPSGAGARPASRALLRWHGRTGRIGTGRDGRRRRRARAFSAVRRLGAGAVRRCPGWSPAGFPCRPAHAVHFCPA